MDKRALFAELTISVQLTDARSQRSSKICYYFQLLTKLHTYSLYYFIFEKPACNCKWTVFAKGSNEPNHSY
jgi:hypothetical protein